jgi:ADP-heptose:LPS heptosyltransferase/O-antigen/teichoic acid export membrane protein
VLRGSLWVLAERVVGLALGVVMTAQLMRYLGTTGYGHYSLALGFAPPFALITDLIAAQVVVREVAARPEATRRIVATAMVLRGLFAFVALLVSALVAWGWGYAPPVRLAILVYSLTLLLAPCDVLAAVLQARLRLRLLSTIGVAATCVNLLLILVAVHARVPLPWIVAAAAAPAFVRALATAWLTLRTVGSRQQAVGSGEEDSPSLPTSTTTGVHRDGGRRLGSRRLGSRRLKPRLERQEVRLRGLRRRVRESGLPAVLAAVSTAGIFTDRTRHCGTTADCRLPTAFDPDLARRLLDGSWPLALAMLLNMVPASLPTFCLGALPDGDALGIFAAASRVPTMLGMIPNAAMVALFPLMARAYHCGAAPAAGVLARAQTAMLALALPLAIGAVVLAEDGMRFLGGDAYTPAVPGLRMMAVSLVLLYPGIAAGHMLIAAGRERTSMVITAVGAVLAVLSAPWLCARYGADGAAAGVACLHAGLSASSLIAAASAVGVAPRFRVSSELRRIVGCAMVMTGVVLLLRRLGLFVAIGGGAAVYAFCIWRTGLLHAAFRFPTLDEVGAASGAEVGPVVDDQPKPGALTRLGARASDALSDLVWRACAIWCRRRARSIPSVVHDPPSSILVLDRDYIGDVVCITPALRALRDRFPAASITLAAAPNVAPLFEEHPDVDRVVALPDARGAIGAVRLIRELRKLAPQSVVIGLGTVPANAWLGQLAGVLCDAPIRLGEVGPSTGAGRAHRRFEELLTHSVARGGGGTPRSGVGAAHSPEPRHWAQIHLDLLAPLGVTAGPSPTRLVTTAEARATVARLLEVGAPTGERGPLARPWIGIHAGGRIYQIPDAGAPGGIARLSRRWPVERFGALARRLTEECGATVFLTGAPEEARTSALVAGPSVTGCIDTTGRLSLAETAALMEQCDVFVTNDTGPMHMAFALGVPTVAIFGPTDPRRVGPIGEEATRRSRILAPALSCAPCAGEALIPCRHPEGQVCLLEIPVGDVFRAVQELLGRE